MADEMHYDEAFLPLYKDDKSKAGVSLVTTKAGRMASVKDLPKHALEVHVFRSRVEAIAFSEGVALASSSRSDLAQAHALDARDAVRSRCVVVARLGEERRPGKTLADCVRVVSHGVTLPNVPRRQHKDESREGRNQRVALMEMLRGKGWVLHSRGPGHLMASHGASGRYRFEWDDKQGVFSLDMTDAVRLPSTAPDDAEARLLAVAERVLGQDLKAGAERLLVELGGLKAVSKRMDVMVDLVTALTEERDLIFRHAFSEQFQMTEERARLIEAGINGGIRVFLDAGAPVGMAGAQKVRLAELQRMEYCGWLKRDGGRFNVTEKGAEAAREVVKEEAPAP